MEPSHRHLRLRVQGILFVGLAYALFPLLKRNAQIATLEISDRDLPARRVGNDKVCVIHRVCESSIFTAESVGRAAGALGASAERLLTPEQAALPITVLNYIPIIDQVCVLSGAAL